MAHFLWALKDAKVVLAKAPGEFVYSGGWGGGGVFVPLF